MKYTRRSPRQHKERFWPFDKSLVNAGLMFSRYKAAAISVRPEKWNKQYNAETLERFCRKAAQQDVDLIVAPEGFLEGYVISDVIWHRERRRSLLDIAEPIDGPYIRRFCELARKLHICLCFGFAERIRDEVFNSAVFIDWNGRICGTYHKVSEGTHPSWRFARQGKKIRAFDTPLGRCGILICSDRWIPLLARTLVLDGAQFILIPTYGSTNSGQNQAVVARARENGVPIVQANVGMGQIISRGEVVAYKWGLNRITTGFIDIPVTPSLKAVNACEREFLRYQSRFQRDWYRKTMASIRKNKPSSDIARSFLPEEKFQKLKKTHWGSDGK